MKGLEKLTSIRLGEVLSQRGVVPRDVITEALRADEHAEESFVDILVSGNHISEWDLAKLVVEHFHLPFISADNFDASATSLSLLPQEVVFKNLIVPLGLFGRVMTVSMPIMTPFHVIDEIHNHHGYSVFPYVGLISDNRRVIQENDPDFRQWQSDMVEEKKNRRELGGASSKDEWTDIFDSADAAVRDSLKP